MLLQAKRNALLGSRVINISDSVVQKAMSREEAALHCHRTTRGVDKTVQMLENLFLTLIPATDTQGAPLLKDEVTEIWDEQRKDIPGCLCTPSLDTSTRASYGYGVHEATHRWSPFTLTWLNLYQGQVTVPLTFRPFSLMASTGGTSLGTKTSLAAQHNQCSRTFSARLQTKVNALSMTVHDHEVMPVHQPLAKYTGESLGLLYRFDQTELAMTTLPNPNQLDEDIDKGFDDANFSYALLTS